MSIVEISLDDIPLAGNDWIPTVAHPPARPQVKGITVSYPSVSHAPPALTTKPKRSILKQFGSDGPKSRKRVRFNNRGRPAGGVRDKTVKCLDDTSVANVTASITTTPSGTPALIPTPTTTITRVRSK